MMSEARLSVDGVHESWTTLRHTTASADLKSVWRPNEGPEAAHPKRPSVPRALGYDIVRRDTFTNSDFEAQDRRIIDEVAPFTRTGSERVYALIQAIKYIVHADVPSAIVECGVWRGGSMMAAAMTLSGLNSIDRDLEHRITMLMNRVDYSARIGVKP